MIRDFFFGSEVEECCERADLDGFGVLGFFVWNFFIFLIVIGNRKEVIEFRNLILQIY